jgi:hypothetical protein
MRFGGPYWWGPRFGIEIPERFVIWNEERVRGALRPFLRGREAFPSEAEFAQAGLRSLRRAVDTHGGGIGYWSDEFGLASRDAAGGWSKEEIRHQLEDLLSGREHFPTQKEFQEAGKMRLFNAIRRNGGPAYWQRRFEIQPPVWSKHKSNVVLPSNDLARRSTI